jgi:hypothetical protein
MELVTLQYGVWLLAAQEVRSGHITSAEWICNFS